MTGDFSIIINDVDTICVNGGRHYSTLGDYISQFGIKTDIYLYIGFGAIFLLVGLLVVTRNKK
jgi:hypothetical protein